MALNVECFAHNCVETCTTGAPASCAALSPRQSFTSHGAGFHAAHAAPLCAHQRRTGEPDAARVARAVGGDGYGGGQLPPFRRSHLPHPAVHPPRDGDHRPPDGGRRIQSRGRAGRSRGRGGVPRRRLRSADSRSGLRLSRAPALRYPRRGSPARGAGRGTGGAGGEARRRDPRQEVPARGLVAPTAAARDARVRRHRHAASPGAARRSCVPCWRRAAGCPGRRRSSSGWRACAGHPRRPTGAPICG